MKRLAILAGMLAAMLVAAVPALGQQPAPQQPIEAVITGVIQAQDPGPPIPTFSITDEVTGVERTLVSAGPEERVDLSQFVGQRVTIFGVLDTQGNPISNFEDPNEIPIFVTRVEPAGAAQQQYWQPADAQYAAPVDQYAAPTDGTATLPVTGGPALLLPAAGLLLGAVLIGLRMIRRRS